MYDKPNLECQDGERLGLREKAGMGLAGTERRRGGGGRRRVVRWGFVTVAVCLLVSAAMSRAMWSVLRSRPAANYARPGQSDQAHGAPFNRTPDVQFDKYSLIIKGERVFLHSAELHPFRLPVPTLWRDVLLKFKAAGLNAVSIYTHMGVHNPARDVLDFGAPLGAGEDGGWKSLQGFLSICKEVGLWVVVRPGPYINAETSAGGIAHWITTEVAGPLRTNASDWEDAWRPYVAGISAEVRAWQVDRGGPVIAVQIDNEYTQTPAGHGEYYESLMAAFREAGIVVPLTYNDPNPGENFINGTGGVDLYGMDSYPQRFDCSNPTVWRPVVETYRTYHERVNPSQPWYIPEFQAGSFDAWGPSAPGYSPACYDLTNHEFMSVFNLQLWASNAKMINYYMGYGGTSWGGLPFPGVYTSYDYGASASLATLTESRALTRKFDELKLEGIFIRSTPDFAKTDWIADSGISTNSDVVATYLRNPDTGSGFYVLRQKNSVSTETVHTSLHITLSSLSKELDIPLVAPAVTLGGRQSKVVVTDYKFGSSHMAYSAASVFFAGKVGGRDVLFLYGRSDQVHEAAIRFEGVSNPWFAPAHDTPLLETDLGTVVTFYSTSDGLVTVWDSDTQLILFGSEEWVGREWWAPQLAGTNETVLVGGPYLVRSASYEDRVLELTGDLDVDRETRLLLIGPSDVRRVRWNGMDVVADAGVASVRALTLVPRLQKQSPAIPDLGSLEWFYHDSLPEISSEYDDTNWVTADRTETNIPEKMWYGDGRVLYGCDYGFCENVVLWRGHFDAVGDERSVNVSINGGQAFAASVWLNDVFLGTSYGNSTNNLNILEETDDAFVFPAGAMKLGANVLTIVQDNMGLNETEGDDADTSKNPRGIRGFALFDGEGALLEGRWRDWKVQGKVGGYQGFPDKLRSVFNEGGLYGERLGWHLPGFAGFDTWTRPSEQGLLAMDQPGVGFFLTHFDLDISEFLDVHLSFEFDDAGADRQPYRAFLFVNGWMMGERVANLGPQSKFPVQAGILDYQGTNTLAVAFWNMEPVPIGTRIKLVIDGVWDSALGRVPVEGLGKEGYAWTASRDVL
ncbi:unnamed protein product [Mycena citricolor]|uniref:beta-galactosidase n=1 Tax=Mycena citricolor TaxID=2018698 RepID=A0AAD2GVW2_9AGAR|nr:unnamed protein product [Mycena citricolor]